MHNDHHEGRSLHVCSANDAAWVLQCDCRQHVSLDESSSRLLAVCVWRQKEAEALSSYERSEELAPLTWRRKQLRHQCACGPSCDALVRCGGS